jgi:hypothetical protein
LRASYSSGHIWGSDGDLMATIEVYGNGSFFTTIQIELGNGQGNGVYPAIAGRSLDSSIHYMNERTNEGGCSNSSCHGVTRAPIHAE